MSETEIEKLNRLYEEEKKKEEQKYFYRGLWFRLAAIFILIVFSLGVALPTLFSGSTEFVLVGFVYLIVIPYLAWILNKCWIRIALDMWRLK